MASNLSTIGFVFEDEDAFRAAMMSCASDVSLQLDCHAGAYGLWRSRTGAEIWFHLGGSEDGETEIHGLTPFFEGQSEVLLKITGVVAREGNNAFEGALTGWVSPGDGSEGSYPIVFDAVDFAAHSEAQWPDLRHVRLTGFARDLQAFANDDAYYAARGKPDAEHLKLAAHAFIPLGMFAATSGDEIADPAEATAPASSAVLTGKILEHRTLTNEATGKDFIWMLAESLEATFDIVADPAVVSGVITDGSIIEAVVMMFGRVLDDQTQVVN
jgi:hypothetical protein